jgi:hypothetical protein
MDEIIETIAASMDDDGAVKINTSDVLLWANERGQTASEFLDSFGLELARRFDQNKLSYNFCDEVVNELWVILSDWIGKPSSKPWPNTFHEIFEAFDAGEHHRKADKADDPIGQFTKPMIADMVRRNR